MAGVTGIGGSTVDYGTIAGGKRINSAADDASGMAIANKLKTQATGLETGADNAQSGKDMIQVADGALGSIGDSLQRIYELSVKASNSPFMSKGDMAAMQDEIGSLMEGIQDTAKGTEFNTMKLLDGSKTGMNMATSPDGSGKSIKMQNATLENLGINGYDVTKDFDISRITDAIDKVSSSRSQLGAGSNALESAYNYNKNASQQTTSSQSKIEDLDIPKAVSEQNRSKVLSEYQMLMKKQKMEDDATVSRIFKF